MLLLDAGCIRTPCLVSIFVVADKRRPGELNRFYGKDVVAGSEKLEHAIRFHSEGQQMPIVFAIGRDKIYVRASGIAGQRSSVILSRTVARKILGHAQGAHFFYCAVGSNGESVQIDPVIIHGNEVFVAGHYFGQCLICKRRARYRCELAVCGGGD